MVESILSWSVLIVAAFLGGGINAVAGGGSFFTFPALVWAGVPPVAANASGTMALLPGYMASTWGFREDLKAPERLSMGVLVTTSLAGGSLGAGLLLITPDDVFRGIVPWLLLAATLLFALGPRLLRYLNTRGGESNPGTQVAALLAVCLYGGYFNGGLGIVLLAAFGLLGHTGLNRMQGLKNLVSAVLTAMAVALYALGGAIVWLQALVMMISAVAGGYVVARLARRLPEATIRFVVIATGAVMTALFFVT